MYRYNNEDNTDKHLGSERKLKAYLVLLIEILWKRGEIAPYEQFLLFSIIFCYLLLDFHVTTGTRKISNKLLFEISKVEIMRVDCIL